MGVGAPGVNDDFIQFVVTIRHDFRTESDLRDIKGIVKSFGAGEGEYKWLIAFRVKIFIDSANGH